MKHLRVGLLLGLSLAAAGCTQFQSGTASTTVAASSLASLGPGLPSAAPGSAAPVATVAADTSHPDIDLTGYRLVFNDEFDAVSVATTSPKGIRTWYHLPPYGSAAYYSQSIWDANAFTSLNGILQNVLFRDGQNRWHSGNLSSVDESGVGFSAETGYFEVRAKMPDSGSGSWPAFWLGSTAGIPGNAEYGKDTLEVDILEWYGVARDQNQAVMQQASHNWKGDGTGSDETSPFLYRPGTPMPNGAKPWQDFHVYGCRIDAAHVTWFIDGVQVNQIAAPAKYMNGRFYMMLDYAIGGGWPLDGLVANSSFAVDWVRVYALPL